MVGIRVCVVVFDAWISLERNARVHNSKFINL